MSDTTVDRPFFDGTILIRQRVAASYRRPFFDMLAERCSGAVTVVAGQPDDGEGIGQFSDLEKANYIATKNVYQGKGPFYRYSQPELIGLIDDLQPSIFFSEANPRFVDMKKTIMFTRKLRIPAI